MKKIKGTSARPRLSVFRSHETIYAQIIDDGKGKTLMAATSLKLAKEAQKLTKKEKAFKTGQLLAKKALKAKIKKVVFDRRAYKYHGRVKALAEGARKGGLEF
jgi:large subunit ribosomal protein L18